MSKAEVPPSLAAGHPSPAAPSGFATLRRDMHAREGESEAAYGGTGDRVSEA